MIRIFFVVFICNGSVVDFPIEGLDMSPWILSEESKQNAIYDLYAISNHMGGLGGGHCMLLFVLSWIISDNAYCKNLIDNKWYLCDDSSVSPVQSITFCQLLYQK